MLAEPTTRKWKTEEGKKQLADWKAEQDREEAAKAETATDTPEKNCVTPSKTDEPPLKTDG